MSKDKILFVLKVPPPIHGSTIMNDSVSESALMKTSFNAEFCRESISTPENIGNVSRKKLVLVLKNYFFLFKKVISFKPDLVYFALSPFGNALFKDVISILIVRVFTRAKIVYHLHVKGIGRQSKKPFFRLIYNFLFNNEFLIHLSQSLVDELKAFDFKNKYVLPNGIRRFDLERSDRLENQVTFLSNLIKEKGIFEFLELCYKLSRGGIDFKINIIGKEMDVHYSDVNSKINEYKLENHINFLGSAYGSKKEELLSSTSILVFPSYYKNECYPLVLLEAQQLGIPVISSKEGAIPEIIKDGVNGFLIDPQNIAGMTQKVELLLRDKAVFKRMSCSSKFFFDQTGSLEKFEENLRVILNDIMDNTTSPK